MFNNIKDIGLITLLILLIIVYYCFTLEVNQLTAERNSALSRINDLNNAISDQNSSISKWKQESLNKEIAIKELEKKIKKKVIDDNYETQGLMAAIVPEGCEDARQWSIIQANRQGMD